VPLRNIDITAAIRRVAERRIEDAMREGKFDNLAGAGKPLDLEPMPTDENARQTWWALRILRNNDFIPDEVRWRKSIDYLRHRLDTLADEDRLSPPVNQFNELVHRINTLGTNALNCNIAPLDLETQRASLRRRLASP